MLVACKLGFPLGSGVVLHRHHRGSTVWCLEQSSKTGEGAPSPQNGPKTQQSLHSAVWTCHLNSSSSLNLHHSRRTPWPLLPRALWCTQEETHSFRGYQVKKQGWYRLVPAALALRNGNSRRATVLKGQPFNPWQP